MRRFDLKEYLDDPDLKVVTRDGREVRILCTDKKSRDDSDYSVVTLIPIRLGGEGIFTYNAKGQRKGSSDYDEDPLGLFFLPVKQVGWINIYKSGISGWFSRRLLGQIIYDNKEQATLAIDKSLKYIATLKIEWEE